MRNLFTITLMVGAAFALSAAPSAAADYTGNDVLRDCDGSGTWVAGACFGRVIGTLSALDAITAASGKKSVICFRPNVTQGQIVDIVTAWLRAHPEKRDFDFPIVVIAAAQASFPCSSTP